MADNTQLSVGTGGDTIRDKDRAGIKTQVVGLDINPAGAEVLGTGDATNGLDVDVTRVQGTVTTSTTVAAALPAGNNNIGDVDIASAPYANADGSGTMPAVVVVVAGNDGTNTQALKTDVNGVLQVAQNGTVTVADGGGSLTVDGTVSISGAVDTELTTADLDTGAGTDTRAVVGLARAESGGAVLVGSGNPLPVSGTVTANAGSGTMAVSAASLPLPSGASTAAKQPALGTAGTASADVITVQGIASMTPVKTDGSAVTQPVSGTVTANAGSGTFTVSGSVTADTELPAAAALADAAANPTIPSVGALGLLFNGSTWDRVRGDTTNGLDVDVTRLPALVAGSALVGRVNVEPQTANGLSTFHLVSAATTNATSVKASAGQLYGYYIYNSNAAARKVAFHNTAGTPTAGASVFFAIVIPPSSAANVEFTNGVAFSTGIAITTVTDLTDAGATAVTVNDLVINIFYK